jgi:hypothetical protein
MLDLFRGSLRISGSQRLPPSTFRLSGESSDAGDRAKQSWLTQARILIPGEALAGFIALQPVAAAADNPDNVKIVLAQVFLIVTIVLRWIGSEDATAPRPRRTAQVGVVVISALSYTLLVYATGGQIFWHHALPDQMRYAQILAAALGIVGPTLYHTIFAG